MTGRNRKCVIAGSIIYFAVICLPIAGMFDTSVISLENPMTYRRISLMWNSIKLGGTTALIACVIGMLAALWIRNSFLRDKWYRYFFVILLPVPYYMYALGWMYLVRWISVWNEKLLKYSMKGFSACLFVEIMTYIPFAMLFILIGLESIKESTIEMALIYRESTAAIAIVILREIMPYLTAAMGCILVLSITDFSVPSMFQYNTYALEIFSVYSRNGSAAEACLLTMPMFVMLFIPLLWVINGIRKVGIPQRDQSQSSIRLHGMLKFLSLFSFGIVLFQIVMPVVTYGVQTGSLKIFFESFQMIKEELMRSILIATVGCVISLLLVLLPAQLLAEKNQMKYWLAFLFPMIIPGSITAMGLLHLINGSPISGIGRTSFLAALGCAVKYAPLLLIWCTALIKRMDKKSLEMAYVLANNSFDIIKMKYRMLLPGLICAMALAFFLAMGEEGIMLVLMAPGKEVASVKIYNYLHYGASEYVSGFCLVIILFMLGLEFLACMGWRVLTHKKRSR